MDVLEYGKEAYRSSEMCCRRSLDHLAVLRVDLQSQSSSIHRPRNQGREMEANRWPSKASVAISSLVGCNTHLCQLPRQNESTSGHT